MEHFTSPSLQYIASVPLVFGAAAERTAAASRLAGALTHCIAKGCNTTPTGNAAIRSSAQHVSLAASADAAVGCVIVIACAESADDLPASLRRCFTHELPVEAPDAAARKHLIQARVMPAVLAKGTCRSSDDTDTGMLGGYM